MSTCNVKTIQIDGEKYVREKDVQTQYIVKQEGDKSNPFMEVNKTYFIRTVTHYFTGRLIWVGEKELVLDQACWIADTGRFNEFIKEQTVNESEPFPNDRPVIIGRGSIIDMVERSVILTVK